MASGLGLGFRTVSPGRPRLYLYVEREAEKSTQGYFRLRIDVKNVHLNTCFGQNFFDFVNVCRVQESQHLLAAGA